MSSYLHDTPRITEWNSETTVAMHSGCFPLPVVHILLLIFISQLDFGLWYHLLHFANLTLILDAGCSCWRLQVFQNKGVWFYEKKRVNCMRCIRISTVYQFRNCTTRPNMLQLSSMFKFTPGLRVKIYIAFLRFTRKIYSECTSNWKVTLNINKPRYFYKKI